jgi:2-amino-4-hydroxy-6-hydroxymethyldihydropteridine diphosphokinase
MIECYLGLGANQQDPKRVLNQAFDHISNIPKTAIGKASEIILTEPFGILGQPRFYNQVIQIFTLQTPLELLRHLLRIEIELGKVRKLSWGPRKIDIDLLIYGKTFLKTPELTIPHPQIWQRDFVKKQLLEYQNPLIEFYYNGQINIEEYLQHKKPKMLPPALKPYFRKS